MLRVLRLVCRVRGITPVDEIMIGIVFIVFTLHWDFSSIDKSVYLLIFSVWVDARLWVLGTAMSMRYTVFVILSKSVMSGLL